MRTVPPLDVHAHIDPSIAAVELDELDAVVFAMTRTLHEAEVATARSDAAVVWGVGCHPSIAAAHRDFSESLFSDLLERTPLAGELGLDGRGRVPLDRQRATLRSALEILIDKPRIASLHSAGATREVLEELSRMPIRGAVLHWWLGDPTLTRQALDLGCYFSVNAAGVNRNNLLSIVPLDRLLTETDHPYGDRRSSPHRPGNVLAVERAVAQHHGLKEDEVRRQMWRNLASIVTATRVGRLMPRSIRTLLAALS